MDGVSLLFDDLGWLDSLLCFVGQVSKGVTVRVSVALLAEYMESVSFVASRSSSRG